MDLPNQIVIQLIGFLCLIGTIHAEVETDSAIVETSWGELQEDPNRYDGELIVLRGFYFTQPLGVISRQKVEGSEIYGEDVIFLATCRSSYPTPASRHLRKNDRIIVQGVFEVTPEDEYQFFLGTLRDVEVLPEAEAEIIVKP